MGVIKTPLFGFQAFFVAFEGVAVLGFARNGIHLGADFSGGGHVDFANGIVEPFLGGVGDGDLGIVPKAGPVGLDGLQGTEHFVVPVAADGVGEIRHGFRSAGQIEVAFPHDDVAIGAGDGFQTGDAVLLDGVGLNLFRQAGLEGGDAGDVRRVGSLADPAHQNAVHGVGIEGGSVHHRPQGHLHEIFRHKPGEAFPQVTDGRSNAAADRHFLRRRFHRGPSFRISLAV